VELEIDFAVTAQYSDCHDFYARNLRIFKSFIRVFENFFKKEKFQNSGIIVDGDAKDRATIRFCSKKYQIGLFIDPADLNSAAIVLSETHAERTVNIGAVAIDKSENIIFPANHVVALKDDYEFNNAVLKFFIAGITKSAHVKASAQ
jgi:hypothetical protein